MFANYVNSSTTPSLSPSAGPSRPRPAPTRTLRQPHSLSVAQRDDNGSLDPNSISDAAAYEQAMRRKVELRRKGDKWAERLSEGVVEEDEFRKGCRYLEPHHFLSLTHERHLTHLCSYPPCPQAPRAKWKSTQTVRISLRRGSVQDIPQGQGNAHAGYCSVWCEARGRHVMRQLEGEGVGWRGKEWRVELLDDVMVRPGVETKGKGQGQGGDGEDEGVMGGIRGEGQSGDGPFESTETDGTAAIIANGAASPHRANGGETRIDQQQGVGTGGAMPDMQVRERPTAPNPVAPSLTGPRASDRSSKAATSSVTPTAAATCPNLSSAATTTADPASHPWSSSSPNRPIDTSIPAHLSASPALPSTSTRIAQHGPPASTIRSPAVPSRLPVLARDSCTGTSSGAASRREYALAPPTALTSEIMAASKLGTIGARIAQAEQAGVGGLGGETSGVGSCQHGNPLPVEDADGLPSEISPSEREHTSATRREEPDALDKAVRVPQWVQDMSFGPEDEDEEIKRLFEEMKMGQDIMRAEGGDE